MISTMTRLRERFGLLDLGIAAVATTLCAVFIALQVGDDTVDATWLMLPFLALCGIPLVWRRVAPLTATAGVLAAVGLHVALFQNDVVRCGVMIPIALLLAYAVGARLALRESLAGLALTLGITLLATAADHPTGADLGAFLGFAGPVVIGVWGVGRLVRSRGRMVTELRARTVELREAREERARLEVADDRARLSAELDGLMQRRLSALAELADAGAGAGDAAEALAGIERESRATLEEMRSIVGVLRDDAADADTAPQPTLTQLDALLLRAKGTGAHLTIDGRPRALPAGVELSAYRVVEHLLDALQDAPGVEVGVTFADDALELRVTGPMRKRGEESVERARERARLHHGEIALSNDGGRAEARVSLPIYATV